MGQKLRIVSEGIVYGRHVSSSELQCPPTHGLNECLILRASLSGLLSAGPSAIGWLFVFYIDP